MTDTVNVQLLPCPFCGGEASIERYGNTRVSTQYHCDDCGCFLETGEEFNHGRSWNTRATLAAAPKAEPEWFSVDDLAQEIRRADGKHDLGAGALAEALTPFIYSNQAKAPKVQQEPVAWRAVWRDSSSYGEPKNWPPIEGADTYHGLMGRTIQPLYTHPAPTSDARVISYEDAHADAVELGYESLTEALEDLDRLQKDRNAFDGLGDNAPASDELLEAIDMDDFNIIGDWIEGGEKGGAPSGRVKGLWQSVRRVIAIAKHKGPQS